MKDKILNSNIKLFRFQFSTKKILLHPLFSGSFIMIIGSNFANFIAYIYHLVFGRMLGPSQYGELVATISLVGLIMSVFSFFSTVIIKFVSSANVANIPSVLDWFNERVLKIAVIVSIFVWLASPFLGNFTHLPRNITMIFAPLLFLSIVSLVYKSFLQGVMKFKESVILANVELLGRLIFGLIFIFMGMKVFGGVLGMLLASFSGVILAKYFLKDIGFSKKPIIGFNWKKVIGYSLPVFVVSFSFTSLLTTDLIMVKHYFSSYDAGIYGAVSNLGKIIFYGTAPIGAVMFPIISKRKALGLNYKNIFLLSVLLLCGLGIFVLVVYNFFPELMIRLLYGEKYLPGSRYLLLMGVYYIFYSLSNLMSYFLLSVDIVKPLLILPVFAVIQLITISFFHSTLAWVLASSILSVSLLLIYLGIYFIHEKKH